VYAGAREEAFASSWVDSTAEQSDPLFRGTIEEFCALRVDAVLQRQMRNTIKKCTGCSKVCAFSLKKCNQCGTELPAEVTFSANIFMGFVYGVEKGPFPLTISIRLQTPEVLVFDDLLSLTPCHLNIIPTNVYIPDWRFLLRRPADGLKLVKKLEEDGWACVSSQFMMNRAWREKYLKLGEKRLSRRALAKLREHVICGCNFPPSQFHLHIQYMMMPLVPFQYLMYKEGAHFTINRFFPLSYIKAVLALGDPMAVTMETRVEDIVRYYEDRVDYHAMHKSCYAQVEKSHQLLANWRSEDFETVIDGDVVVGSDRSRADQVAADKQVIQNYGRPYTSKGRPSGTYYKFARSDTLPEWQEMNQRKFSQSQLPGLHGTIKERTQSILNPAVNFARNSFVRDLGSVMHSVFAPRASRADRASNASSKSAEVRV